MEPIISPKLRARMGGRVTTGHTAGPCARCGAPVVADEGYMADLVNPFTNAEPVRVFYCPPCVARNRQTQQ